MVVHYRYPIKWCGNRTWSWSVVACRVMNVTAYIHEYIQRIILKTSPIDRLQVKNNDFSFNRSVFFFLCESNNTETQPKGHTMEQIDSKQWLGIM